MVTARLTSSPTLHSGIIGERLPIRLYLTAGMLSSGVFTCLFGLGYIYNIHSLSFYIFVQVSTHRARPSVHERSLMVSFAPDAGGQRPGPNHWLAQCGDLHRELVWERKVSSA